MTGTLGVDALHQAAVPTSDLARSVAFYRDVLGLRLIAEYSPPGLAFFALGNTRLLVDAAAAEAGPEAAGAEAAGAKRETKPASGVLYFHVPDIHAAAAALRARGVPLDSDPHLIFRDAAGTFGAAGEEEWMAFFRDPDGNVLALAARVPAKRE